MCNVDDFTFLTRKESWSVHVSPPGAVTYYFDYPTNGSSRMESEPIWCKRMYKEWNIKLKCKFPIPLYLYFHHVFSKDRSHYSYELEQIATFWEDCTCSRKYFCKAETDYLIYRMRTQRSCDIKFNFTTTVNEIVTTAIKHQCSISYIPEQSLSEKVKPCRKSLLINKCNVTGTWEQYNRNVEFP
jgi:hypothetical protein